MAAVHVCSQHFDFCDGVVTKNQSHKAKAKNGSNHLHHMFLNTVRFGFRQKTLSRDFDKALLPELAVVRWRKCIPRK